MKKVYGILTVTLLTYLMSMVVVTASNNPYGQETANDLFELYNKATLEEYTKIQQEYQDALSQYNKANHEVVSGEIYNEVYASAEKYQQCKLEEIDLEIEEILERNKAISKEIEENITASWDVLHNLDLKFKGNLSKIDTLLSKKNKYKLTALKNIDYSSLDELCKELEDLEQRYKATSEVSVLGDVSNVRYPLNKETVVTSEYGNRIDPMTGNTIRFHAGIDLRAAIGTEVQSLFNGVVTHTGYGALGGYYVRVDHGNGITTYYCHLSEITCEVGQVVSQYEAIALSGNTGLRTTGPHLHMGLYINGNPVDPGILFNKE